MYIGHLLHGDMGYTVRGHQPVAALIFERLPNTLALAACSMLVAFALGLPLGFLAASRRGSVWDTGLMTAALVGVSLPNFWLGLMLMFLLAVRFEFLPVAGTGLLNIVLPALTLGLSNAAIVARMTRASMIDVMAQDFVRTARARGLPETTVLRRHVLRAGLVPIVTMAGLQFAAMMGGAIVVENIFAWNGIGRLAVDAIFQRDYPLIQGFILVFASVVVCVSILIDVCYAFLDPRVRRSRP